MIAEELSGKLIPERIKLAAANATHANATISIGVTSNSRVIIHGIQLSYSAAPTGGRLTVSDGTTTFDLDIPGTFEEVQSVLAFAFGADVTVTLYDGGAAIVGKLNVEYTLQAE